MKNIKIWFEEQKETNPDWADAIDKILEGLSERGFDSSSLNQWIDGGLNKIKTDYEAEFIKEVDDEA